MIKGVLSIIMDHKRHIFHNNNMNNLLLLIILFFFCPVCSSSNHRNGTDKLVLLSFKSKITEDPTQVLASWNESIYFCQWRGVTCGRRHPQRVTALDLASLDLAGKISPFLSNLSFLRRLHLPSNRFFGGIPQELGYLFHLQHLNLSSNPLGGKIPSSLSTHCSHLENLSLSESILHGEIPHNLSRCSNLTRLDLSGNMLVGSIPRALGTLPVLTRLILRRNNLTGSIPHELGNLSSLATLYLVENNLHGSIPVDICRIPQLKVLDLGSNKLSGVIPPLLFNISSLFAIGVYDNRLVGTLPTDLGCNLPSITYLSVSINQLKGPIPWSLANASHLEVLNLGGNNISGPIPSNMGSLGYLRFLQLSGNHLEAGDDEWSFLKSLTNCSQLRFLGLATNRLRGALPNVIGNLSTKLDWLLLQENQISGKIPPEIGNLVNITALALYENFLIDTIPESIGLIGMLESLLIDTNNLSGKIPTSLGNLSRLYQLSLGKNHLTGSIPTTFLKFQNMQALYLSFNNLSGSIPGGIVGRPSSLITLDLSHNLFTGFLPSEIGTMENLVTLAISDNKLSGEIPSTIGNCPVIEILLFENNLFQGTIPASLAELKGLRLVNLSSNNLSGNIPEFKSPYLVVLDLSFNNLEGRVPVDGVFRNLTVFSATGNMRLCGGVPELHLSKCPIEGTKKRNTSSRRKSIIIFVPIIVALCLIFVIYILTRKIWLRKPMASQHVASPEDPYARVSYGELLKATDGFSHENLIGIGSFGSVYKGVMGDDHKVVAVKVLNLQQRGGSKSFVAECDAVRNIRHHNLVKVLTSCSGVDFKGDDFKALVFEFMPNGSLEDWLHPQEAANSDPRPNLSLLQRLNIAVDVAYALDYLHLRSHDTIVHCDLKPSNVLLDNDMVAHVSDFGLARFLSKSVGTQRATSSTSTIGIKGSIGYIAPEYGMGGQVSTHGDVYSFGILVLEMFTGKRPTGSTFKDGMDLRKFVQRSFPSEIVSIIDPQLLPTWDAREGNEVLIQSGDDDEDGRIQECLLSVIRIGLSCSRESPQERMGIGDVAKELHAIREKFRGAGA